MFSSSLSRIRGERRWLLSVFFFWCLMWCFLLAYQESEAKEDDYYLFLELVLTGTTRKVKKKRAVEKREHEGKCFTGQEIYMTTTRWKFSRTTPGQLCDSTAVQVESHSDHLLQNVQVVQINWPSPRVCDMKLAIEKSLHLKLFGAVCVLICVLVRHKSKQRIHSSSWNIDQRVRVAGNPWSDRCKHNY